MGYFSIWNVRIFFIFWFQPANDTTTNLFRLFTCSLVYSFLFCFVLLHSTTTILFHYFTVRSRLLPLPRFEVVPGVVMMYFFLLLLQHLTSFFRNTIKQSCGVGVGIGSVNIPGVKVVHFFPPSPQPCNQTLHKLTFRTRKSLTNTKSQIFWEEGLLDALPSPSPGFITA